MGRRGGGVREQDPAGGRASASSTPRPPSSRGDATRQAGRRQAARRPGRGRAGRERRASRYGPRPSRAQAWASRPEPQPGSAPARPGRAWGPPGTSPWWRGRPDRSPRRGPGRARAPSRGGAWPGCTAAAGEPGCEGGGRQPGTCSERAVGEGAARPAPAGQLGRRPRGAEPGPPGREPPAAGREGREGAGGARPRRPPRAGPEQFEPVTARAWVGASPTLGARGGGWRRPSRRWRRCRSSSGLARAARRAGGAGGRRPGGGRRRRRRGRPAATLRPARAGVGLRVARCAARTGRGDPATAGAGHLGVDTCWSGRPPGWCSAGTPPTRRCGCRRWWPGRPWPAATPSWRGPPRARATPGRWCSRRSARRGPRGAMVRGDLAGPEAEPLVWDPNVTPSSSMPGPGHLQAPARLSGGGLHRRRPPAGLQRRGLGNDAMGCVLAGADLDRAAQAAAIGGFANAGLLCMAGERIIVERPAWEGFRPHLAAAVRRPARRGSRRRGHRRRPAARGAGPPGGARGARRGAGPGR